jgi:predicted dehydrogenase
MTTRREFIKTAAAGGAGLWLSGTGWPQASGSAKRRYAIVGTGGRHSMYREAILGRFAPTSELVGLCDINTGRARLSQGKARAMSGKIIPIYEAKDFDRMIAETKPDSVIVTTVDSFHDQYIVRAMELGCDAITEKPMTNHEDKCRRTFS